MKQQPQKCSQGRTVYVINKSGHNYEDALRFGKLCFLTEGRVKQSASNHLYRQICEAMKDSTKDDYVLITSMAALTGIACAVFARKHGRLNLLLFIEGRYIERNLLIDELL